jgi:predicted ATPase/DNA-binding SARP family transcriptional activator
LSKKLEVRLLGAFEISHGGKTIAITSRPAQSLFAYLILNAGALHRREKLAGLLWPDSLEETARENLRHALWRMRKAFPTTVAAEYVRSDDLSIGFNASALYWLDAAEVEKLNETTSADSLIATLSVYRGELLPGFYDEWVVLEREHISSLFEHHMARLMSMLQEQKRWLDLLDWGERWIRLGQKPEPAYRALMVAHAAHGDLSKVAVTYERCVKSLRELGIQPSEQTRALYQSLKTEKPSLRTDTAVPVRETPPAAPKTNLPVPLTSFIGREREIEEVKRLLSTTRLLTLAGAGGIGKTRLAIQAARELVRSYPDGVWWVELAPLTDGELVPPAVAQVLDIREPASRSWTAAVKDFLDHKQTLIVMDNCEHVLTACTRLVDDLLSHCAGLRILATSREALGITGETTLQVPALSFPRLAHLSQLQNLNAFESIQLFVERAAAFRQDLALTQENAFAVMQICQRLDGIPLALELAAARVKILSLEEIASRLDHRLSLLTQGGRTALPRHQTLRATIDWSYELLSEPERMLLRRLSVFAGSFTLEAAEAVAAAEDLPQAQVMDLLESLLNKSLVMIHGQPEQTRYRMLEIIHEYAREKLSEAGEEADLRARHLDFFVAFAERAQRGIYSTEQAVWFKRLDPEVDNLRWALDESLTVLLEARQIGKRSVQQSQFVIVSSLSLFWERGHRSETIETLGRLLRLASAREPTAEKARALDVGGFLLWSLNRLPEARTYLEESIQIAERLKDDSLLVWPLMYLGWTFWGLREYDQARKRLERSLEIARSLGEREKGAVGVAIAYLGDIPYAQGNFREARRHYEEAIAMFRELQNPSMLTPSLRRLAYLELREGNIAQAARLFHESLEWNRQLGHHHGMVACLAGFAAVHLAKKNREQAAVLCEYVASQLEGSGNPLLFTDTLEYERLRDQLRRELDEKDLSIALTKGRAMTLEQALALGLAGLSQGEEGTNTMNRRKHAKRHA